MKCSPEALPHKSIIPILLRYDIDPLHISGEKLKAMFHQHGSFEELEIQVKKHHMKSREDAKTRLVHQTCP